MQNNNSVLIGDRLLSINRNLVDGMTVPQVAEMINLIPNPLVMKFLRQPGTPNSRTSYIESINHGQQKVTRPSTPQSMRVSFTLF